jgi:rubredoxin
MNNYYCPMCKAKLVVDNNLVLAVKSRTNEKGIAFLNPEVGNYDIKTHPEFNIEEGKKYDFYCPACHFQLNDEKKEQLVRVFMEDDDDKEFEVYFSNMGGEKATYQIDVREKKAVIAGINKARYEKYFELDEKYKKYL